MEEFTENENTTPTSEERKNDELVARVVENPEVLSKVLDTPQGQAIVCQHFQGPVPPPAMLKEYDQLMPGLANRLVELTEKEQRHRHQMVSDTVSIAKSGQTKAFWIALSVIISAVVFGLMGERVLAGALVTIDLAALVSAFIAGKHYSRNQDSGQE